MKIAVVGTGAIGCLFAARLARAGHQVSAVARGDTLEALRQRGVVLEQNGERSTFSLRAEAEPEALGAQDLVIIAVKEPALAAIASKLEPLFGPETRVLIAMNGVPWWFFDGLSGPLQGMTLHSIDPEGQLRRQIPSERVIGCVVHLACSSQGPGITRLGFGNRLIVGEAVGEPGARLEAVAEALAQCGFEVEISQRIQQDIWYKLWGNLTHNPVSAITGATCDRILDDPLVSEFCTAIMAEAAIIGARFGCPIGQSPAERNLKTRELGAFKTSMLQDVEQGRPVELQALLGTVHEIAQAVGFAAPNISALYGLTRLFANVRGLG